MARSIAHILLVDDEDDHHFITRLALRKSGYEGTLVSVYSAEEAIHQLRTMQPRPDLLLVDINMPGTSGFEMLGCCEQEGLLPNGTTLVVMCSSSNRPMDILAAKQLRSVDDYIEKAFNEDQFRRLQAAFEQKAA
ncbi:MAG: response regulator [Flavobacteriales bacterium]|nr:response regulator [Flavobacteriales bacterium]